jgi:hypothetical protein
MARTPLSLRTRLTRVVRKTICCSITMQMPDIVMRVLVTALPVDGRRPQGHLPV